MSLRMRQSHEARRSIEPQVPKPVAVVEGVPAIVQHKVGCDAGVCGVAVTVVVQGSPAIVQHKVGCGAVWVGGPGQRVAPVSVQDKGGYKVQPSVPLGVSGLLSAAYLQQTSSFRFHPTPSGSHAVYCLSLDFISLFQCGKVLNTGSTW